ncbi:MAG: ORF6N domain-containing protein [bacterium]
MQMKDKKTTNLIPQEAIQNKILVLRDKKVMVDRDLAMLYNVKPIAMRQQVKRNIERFPHDFMFQLTNEEADILVSQNVIPSKQSLGGYLPYAFTENGVAMLSSVLNSKRAININIQIMRAFTRMRTMFEDFNKNRDLIEKVKKDNDERFRIYHKIIEAHSKDIKTIYKLLTSPEESGKEEIGFKIN